MFTERVYQTNKLDNLKKNCSYFKGPENKGYLLHRPRLLVKLFVRQQIRKACQS